MKYGFENNKFYIEFPAMSRVPGNMREESDRRAIEIAETYKKPLLGISSGVDSQSVLHSFWTQGIPLDSVFFYMPNYNDLEYNQLQQIKKKYGTRIDVIDIDPMKYEEEVLIFSKEHKMHPIQSMQKVFLSFVSDDYDFIQMTHDPFTHISSAGNFYYYQNFSSPEISRSRAANSLNRTGKYIGYGETSEFLFSILNDDVYKSALYTHRYFDGNGLNKPNCLLKTVDRWDYYIKPLIYGKYWKDELIYFPKYGGWEQIPFMNRKYTDPDLALPDTTWFKEHGVAIPFFEFLTDLRKNRTNRYYENITQ